MSAHTPGPWTIEESMPGDGHHFIHGADGTCVLCPDDGWNSNYRDYDSRLANARLIAAAPELLDCCKELRDALAGAMRVMVAHACAEGDALTEDFVSEIARLGISDGIGVRADAAIANAEGAK